MWLCCPSAFKPDVGPRVVSEAGEPASPRAAAAARRTTICWVLKPILAHIGTNKTAKIGIVPKEVPIPIVIKSPSINITRDVSKMLSGSIFRVVFTKVSINEEKTKAKIEVLGMAYLLKRINMERIKVSNKEIVENN